ncbi:uncharacterized protein LOC18995788 [Amborella trichopoda]|uniref:N-acetyltransferase domain-containing protein n=1 Tax=Amborella trichopoda TaxID=13333 RepID=W1PMH2_AMBTC|nr:uncharacterized protein LOC18995788 [Amborella trichopoda]ERN08365.1 hypothetical protein AMTR_s00148p00043320 [Amborella trichopoda]|eukprot:XP_006846784.1 uncharacterized protein LOC18995788 [Amborella trichopoda]
MQTLPLSSYSNPNPNPNPNFPSFCNFRKVSFPPKLGCSPFHPPKTAICRASHAVDLFPSICPDVVVREARVDDCWEVAETHCNAFFPSYSFPLDLMLRIDRLIALLSGFSAPVGCIRKCLVADIENPMEGNQLLAASDYNISGFEGKFGFNRGSVTGILTVDTVGDFLPRKGPQRRTGIAYISNVAVQHTHRRKGIAKRLVIEAEAQARSWGCRAITLHCETNNPAALALYKGQGFKCIRVPNGAKWPEPKSTPGSQFHFMMKLLKKTETQKCFSCRV